MHLRLMLATLAVMILGGWVLAPAQEKRSAEEYEVKAAFLYNFSKFVEWPKEVRPSAGGPFRIGVAGKDPSGGALERGLSGKSTQGSPITVEFFEKADAAKSFHMVFVPVSAKDLEESVLKETKGTPVLTVGERDNFVQAGGLFNFYLDENKVRLELDKDATLKSGLTVSSKLLRVARLVR